MGVLLASVAGWVLIRTYRSPAGCHGSLGGGCHVLGLLVVGVMSPVGCRVLLGVMSWVSWWWVSWCWVSCLLLGVVSCWVSYLLGPVLVLGVMIFWSRRVSCPGSLGAGCHDLLVPLGVISSWSRLGAGCHVSCCVSCPVVCRVLLGVVSWVSCPGSLGAGSLGAGCHGAGCHGAGCRVPLVIFGIPAPLTLTGVFKRST